MRLPKYLAQFSSYSRRKAEKLIFEGKVKVNGEVITEPGIQIDIENDTVILDGKKIKAEAQMYYIALHKPRNVVCSREDKHAKRTVIDLLPDYLKHVHPVGRLDKDSEGLLLLSNDGDFTYKLTHPKFHVAKQYLVKTKGNWSEAELKKLAKPLTIDGVSYQATEYTMFLATNESTSFIFTLHEGKKRQIRVICEHLGHPVEYLKRLQIGSLQLGDLKKEQFRNLSEIERESLLSTSQHDEH